MLFVWHAYNGCRIVIFVFLLVNENGIHDRLISLVSRKLLLLSQNQWWRIQCYLTSIYWIVWLHLLNTEHTYLFNHVYYLIVQIAIALVINVNTIINTMLIKLYACTWKHDFPLYHLLACIEYRNKTALHYWSINWNG